MIKNSYKTLPKSVLYVDDINVSYNNFIIPKGFYTCLEYAKKFNVSRPTMERRIKRRYKQGKVIVSMFPNKTILGTSRTTPYYKVTDIKLLDVKQIIPKGFYTCLEYAKKFNVSNRTIEYRIKPLYKQGKAIIKIFPRKTILGTYRLTPHYKITDIKLLKQI